MPPNEAEQAAALQRFGEAVNEMASAINCWLTSLMPAILHMRQIMDRIQQTQRREFLEVLEARIGQQGDPRA
jgi:hypothetical protein